MNQSDPKFGQHVVRKITWRILPFVFLLYIVSYIDRANIGYAALQMNKELALTSEAFGFVSGIFFLGYFLFEVPSNIALNRFGARVWIARILITWGIVATLTGFAQDALHLYVLRFLLGVAEAGFFPGIIVYLTYWFRKKELAQTVAMFTAAIPVSYLIGAPISTWIMEHVSFAGLSGWRCMLILEGAPAIILGVVCYLILTEKPADAKWLKPEERDWLLAELENDRKANPNAKHLTIVQAILNPKVLYLSFIYFVYQCGSLGTNYWMPQIIKSMSTTLSTEQVGYVAMIPYIFATVAMVWWSRHSDRTGERKMHSALPLGLATVGMVGAGFFSNPIVALAMVTIALSSLYAFKAPFWAVPTLFLTRETAAVSIAVINSIGNLGGFVGPYAIGLIKGATGSAQAGLIFLSSLLLISFVMTLMLRLSTQPKLAVSSV